MVLIHGRRFGARLRGGRSRFPLVKSHIFSDASPSLNPKIPKSPSLPYVIFPPSANLPLSNSHLSLPLPSPNPKNHKIPFSLLPTLSPLRKLLPFNSHLSLPAHPPIPKITKSPSLFSVLFPLRLGVSVADSACVVTCGSLAHKESDFLWNLNCSAVQSVLYRPPLGQRTAD
jgi:hypothetical protein